MRRENLRTDNWVSVTHLFSRLQRQARKPLVVSTSLPCLRIRGSLPPRNIIKIHHILRINTPSVIRKNKDTDRKTALYKITNLHGMTNYGRMSQF
jgi:hypothetical protein